MTQTQPRRLLILSAAAIFGLALVGAKVYAQSKDAKSEKMKERLEQLFIWRVSDKLELTTQEEAKFTETYHKLAEERSKLSDEMDETLDQIEKAKDDPAKSAKLLSQYESASKKYDQIQTREMEEMNRLLGTKRMVQYVLLKREMKQKIRDFLVSNTGPGAVVKTNLKEPQVFQEK